MIVPWPIQEALRVALADDGHVAEQRARYAARREIAAAALVRSGFRIDHSQAGLYLWATRGDDAWQTVADLAEIGLLVVPGTFYTDGAPQHVRIALTVSDADVDTAVERLAQLS